MDRPLCLMLIFFGGGLGSLIRVYISPDSTEPFMWANIIACILAGHGFALTRYKVIKNEFLIAFYSIGFLGGLSTFTPLVMNSIKRSESMHGLLSIVYLFIDIIAYTIISGIIYYITTIYLKKVKKLTPPPNIMKAYKEMLYKKQAQEQETARLKAQIGDLQTRSSKQKQRKAQQAAAKRKNLEKAALSKKKRKEQYDSANDNSNKSDVDITSSELRQLKAAKEQALESNDAEETIRNNGLNKEQEAAALQAHEEAKRAALEAYERVLKEKLNSLEKSANVAKNEKDNIESH